MSDWSLPIAAIVQPAVTDETSPISLLLQNQLAMLRWMQAASPIYAARGSVNPPPIGSQEEVSGDNDIKRQIRMTEAFLDRRT